MRKIPTLFIRNPSNPKLVTDQVTPGCEWVFARIAYVNGFLFAPSSKLNTNAVATRKWDGTACLVRGGQLYKRNEWREDKGQATVDWLHWDFNPDQRHGHGWVPVGNGPEDKMYREAWAIGLDNKGRTFVDRTYELIGPRIGKNPEHVNFPILVPHGEDILDPPLELLSLRSYLKDLQAEGIVWYNPETQDMAKLKRRDYGFPWPIQ